MPVSGPPERDLPPRSIGRKISAEKQTDTDAWKPVPGKPGFFVNSEGQRAYDPFLDPHHSLKGST